MAITAFTGMIPIVLFSFSFIPLGYALARSNERHESPVRSGLNGLLLLLSIWVFYGALYAVVDQVNPYTEMLKGLDQGLATTYNLYRDSANLPADAVAELDAAVKQFRALIGRIFPGLLLISAISTVWLNLVIGNLLLKRYNQSLVHWGDYRQWRLAEQLVWLGIGAGLLLLLPVRALNTIGLNAVMALGALYFFQGLAVLTNFLTRWSIPQLLKIIIYVMVLIQVYGILLLTIIGVADTWADFRKTRTNLT